MGIYQKNNSWYIDYYAEGKRVREKIGSSKKMAETVLQKRLVAVAEGKHLDIKKKRKRITFLDFSEKYLEYARVNKKSYKSDEVIIGKLRMEFKGKNLDEISTWIIEKFKLKKVKKVTPTTVNRYLACLKHMYNLGIDWGDIDKNPVIKVKFFKEPNPRVRYLITEEIERLLSECCDHLKPIVLCALHTGMRRGEILNLTWSNVDFRNNIIVLEETKSGRRREIPLSETLEAELKELKRLSKSEFVFVNSEGNKFRDNKKGFNAAVRRAGITDFRFHDLRHTFASTLVMNGETLNTVRELLGHQSMDMTLRYSHLSKSHKSKAVKVMDQVAKRDVSHYLVTGDNIRDLRKFENTSHD